MSKLPASLIRTKTASPGCLSAGEARSIGAIIAAFAVCLIPLTPRPVVAQPKDSAARQTDAALDEPEDRLPRKLEGEIERLVRQGKPDGVRALIAGRPKMDRVYLARALARAGIKAKSADKRDKHFEEAVAVYREVILLEADAGWLRGERRRLRIAQWRVELGDLILRHWAAPDLDRYEITSGLEFDRPGLTARLREAHSAYLAADGTIEDLTIGLRTDEERYLLLGIAEDVAVLHDLRRLNGAWAALYLAMAGGEQAPDRPELLSLALSAFDDAARAARESDRKYNALLGAGITLYHKGRFAEAQAAFERIESSTASLSLVVRARFEMARAYIAARRFAEARNELEALAARPASGDGPDDDAAGFYLKLAPLIHAYSYLLESETTDGPIRGTEEELRNKAIADLAAISGRGGIWPEIVQVYLDAHGGQGRALTDLADAELRIKAGRLLGKKDYEGAIEAFKIILQRSSMQASHAEAAFNVGACYFQTGRVPEAGDAFLRSAHVAGSTDLAKQAAEYAYRCRRQWANETKAPADYLLLAESAELIGERFPDHPLAAESGWLAALARQEAGDYTGAQIGYARVPRSSGNYWPARRNAAVCMQRLYATLTESESAHRRRTAAMDTADAWRRLARDLAGSNPAVTSQPAGRSNAAEIQRWIGDAQLAAAALLAGDDVRAYDQSLELLSKVQPTPRVLALRIRCYRGLGDLATANRVLSDFLKEAGDEEAGSVLIGLAAQMESEVQRLRMADRRAEAAALAAESVDTIQQLLAWMQGRPHHQRHVPTVRHSLVRMLAQAGRRDEASREIERLTADEPGNGNYVRTAALLQEELAASAPPSSRSTVLDKAAAYWAKLLEDPGLRRDAPEVYWEARYHWLRHQLRHGRAAEVIKGVESERAWQPDLGGPPWQDRLLDLLDQARAAPISP